MKFLTDGALLSKRHVTKTFRSPAWLIIGISQPVLYLLLYMPLLKNVAGSGATITSAEVARLFVPGMLVIMSLGSLFAGFGFIPEMRQGLIARWLVTPANRIAILLSMVFNNLVTLFVQSLVLLVIAYFFGLRISVAGGLLTLVLILLIGCSMASLSYTISLTTKNEMGLAQITNTFYLPVILLSGVMLPISLAPHWIKVAAKFNPFYYAVEASRSLFAGNFSAPIVWGGFGVMVVLAALCVWSAVRALQKMSA
jgi:ABC-2 type transport system permease protein